MDVFLLDNWKELLYLLHYTCSFQEFWIDWITISINADIGQWTGVYYNYSFCFSGKVERSSKGTGKPTDTIPLPIGGNDRVYGLVAVTETCPGRRVWIVDN